MACPHACHYSSRSGGSRKAYCNTYRCSFLHPKANGGSYADTLTGSYGYSIPDTIKQPQHRLQQHLLELHLVPGHSTKIPATLHEWILLKAPRCKNYLLLHFFS